MIEISGLVKSYGRVQALRGISFEVSEGETFGLIGPNGAGKTTAFKCLLGLVNPTAGTAKIGGIDIRANPKAAKALVGYLPQRAYFPENLRVWEVMECCAQLRHVKRERIESVLGRVGLQDAQRRKVGELSGGNLQRLGLAQALLSDPPVLILDEPTLSLDPQGVIEFKRIVKEETRKGKTILISSHILSEVEELSHRVGILVRGKMVAMGSIKSLKERLQLRSTLWVVLEKPSSKAIEIARALGLEEVVMNGKSIRVPADPETKVAFLKALLDEHLEVLDFWIEEPSLEEAFIKYVE